MKKTILASILATAFSVPVMAQTTEVPAAAEASPHSLTGNLGIFSSYRFRGVAQTNNNPDYSHSSGIYLGNWNSNVSSGAGFPDGNIEMDFYGGYKHAFGDFGLDVGAIYYYYPGSHAKVLSTVKPDGGAVNNKEIYIGGSWKFLSAKYSYAFDDYFSLRGVDRNGNATTKGTSGTSYFEVNGNYDLGDGWGVNGHVGTLNLKNVHNGDYTDWKIGVTKDISGWVVALSYVDTNASGKCSGASTYQPYCFYSSLSDSNGTLQTSSHTKDAGNGIAIVSVSKSF